MLYDKLCEMNIKELLHTVIGNTTSSNNMDAIISKPVQPTDNIGRFGNEADIHIKETPEGGIEIDSKELAIKISNEVFEAIKIFITKGE